MSQEPAAEPPFAQEKGDFGLSTAQVSIVGLGLIGGSLALALRGRRACRSVYGVARRSETVAEALRRGAIDRGTTLLAEGVANADLVILATPVREIINLIPQVGSLVKPGCLLLDVGSTKQAIMEVMGELPADVQAIGGHPMCGKETNGLEVAEAELFQGATFVLTPLARSRPHALQRAADLAYAIGARPLVMDAERHDRLVATASHLPYLLAVGLMAVASEVAATDGEAWSLASSGFRDSSRLAGSDVKMMLDILMTNRDFLKEMASLMKIHLNHLIDLISRGDERELENMLTPLQRQRRAMFQREKP